MMQPNWVNISKIFFFKKKNNIFDTLVAICLEVIDSKIVKIDTLIANSLLNMLIKCGKSHLAISIWKDTLVQSLGKSNHKNKK